MVNNAAPKAKRCVGVLMLNTDFPRFIGDVGNPDSFEDKVLYKAVEGAHIPDVVKPTAISNELLAAFIGAGEELIDQGADVVVTSCGFLHAVQHEMSCALGKPVITSALVWYSRLRRRLGAAARLGILTFDSKSLTVEHLQLEAWDNNVKILGMEHSEYFYSVIKDNKAAAEFDRMRLDAVAVAQAMASFNPVAVILECTNLSPYRKEIELALKVPVYDLFDAVADLS